MVKAYGRIAEIAGMGREVLMIQDWSTLGKPMLQKHAIRRRLSGSERFSERVIAAYLDAGA